MPRHDAAAMSDAPAATPPMLAMTRGEAPRRCAMAQHALFFDARALAHASIFFTPMSFAADFLLSCQ
jgi:hypothetical protein